MNLRKEKYTQTSPVNLQELNMKQRIIKYSLQNTSKPENYTASYDEESYKRKLEELKEELKLK
jgi:hypothetical protein